MFPPGQWRAWVRVFRWRTSEQRIGSPVTPVKHRLAHPCVPGNSLHKVHKSYQVCTKTSRHMNPSHSYFKLAIGIATQSQSTDLVRGSAAVLRRVLYSVVDGRHRM